MWSACSSRSLRTLSVLAAILAVCGVDLRAQQTAAPAPQGARVRTVTDTLPGSVGGVTVDRVGFIYVADFMETVWKITPQGTATVFATGLYGASGNAIDSRGNLLQANFAGHSISRIDRRGNAEIFAEGLRGPVGIAVTPGDTAFVCNCQGNSVSRVLPDGSVEPFATGDLFNCPNGIVWGGDGNLYVVNFSDEKMLKITPDGSVSEFASLPGGGNGHVTVARGRLYATSFQGQRIYQVSFDGTVSLLAGTGAFGERDGPAAEATFTWPNGIAAGPLGDRVYVNDFLNRFPPTVEQPPQPLFTVRQIKLPSIAEYVGNALRAGGIPAMVEAYRQWKTDPATAALYTEFETNGLGYALMQQGQLDAAIELFRLNVESYPRSWNVYDSLAEAYMNAGQDQRAIEFYEKSLEINPGNQNAVRMIAQIRGGQ